MVLQQIVRSLFFSAAVGLCLVGCDKDSRYDYDNGYEAAWDESAEPSWYSSKEYKDGYEQGKEDAEVYDMGYFDGYNKEKCAYPKDPDYMDGFKDGVKTRNRSW